MKTVKQIAEKANRAGSTISAHIHRLNIKPCFSDKIKSSFVTNFYSEKDTDIIIKHIWSLNQGKRRIKGLFFPDIIYVTRTTEIFQSKMNFLTLEQLCQHKKN